MSGMAKISSKHLKMKDACSLVKNGYDNIDAETKRHERETLMQSSSAAGRKGRWNCKRDLIEKNFYDEEVTKSKKMKSEVSVGMNRKIKKIDDGTENVVISEICDRFGLIV